MSITRPPKEIDLPTILFTQPGFRPSYGNTSALEQVRKQYRKGELTMRLQRSGLFLIRSLMLGAEFSGDPEANQYARKLAAMIMIGSSWHSFAEVRPNQDEFPPRDIRRRRLLLPDYTRIPAEERLNSAALHSKATEDLANCILQANRSINSIRAGSKELREAVAERTGRMLGNTALQVVSADIGDTWNTRPHMGSLDTQIQLMFSGQQLITDSVALSNELGNVESLAMLADPRPNPLQEYVWDTIPRTLTDNFEAMKDALHVV